MASSIAFLASSSATPRLTSDPESIQVNDIHSQLNPTSVIEILEPRSLGEVQNIVRSARKDRKPISVAGGRHAMGGQQFGADTRLIDIRKMNRVVTLDRETGIIYVNANEVAWTVAMAPSPSPMATRGRCFARVYARRASHPASAVLS